MNDNQKLVCILIILIALAFGLYLIIPKVQESYTTYKQVQEKQAKVQSTQKQIDDLRAQKQAYEREEKSATKPVYKSDIASLDAMASFGIMFEDVIQAAKYNGLKLRSIEYTQNPPDDVVSQNVLSDYNVCAVKMQLIGTYAQFRSYFEDIANYPYLINLDKISIFPYEGNKKILIADIQVNLYAEKNAEQKAAYEAARAAENQGDEAVEGTAAAGAIQGAAAEGQ